MDCEIIIVSFYDIPNALPRIYDISLISGQQIYHEIISPDMNGCEVVSVN
jgi:hypothetical protein